MRSIDSEDEIANNLPSFRLNLKAGFQSAEFPERAEILLFARENVALKLNR